MKQTGTRRLRVTSEFLAQLLRTPSDPDITSVGMPADAEIVNAFWYDQTGILVLHVSSADFAGDDGEKKDMGLLYKYGVAS